MAKFSIAKLTLLMYLQLQYHNNDNSAGQQGFISGHINNDHI